MKHDLSKNQMAQMLANRFKMFTFKQVLGKYHHLNTCYNNVIRDKRALLSDIVGNILLAYD